MDLTKRQIALVEAARLLISKGGVQNATIKNLANEIGVTEPAIYRHFKDKTALLSACLAYFRQQLQGLLQDIMQTDLPVPDKVAALISRQFAHFAAEPTIVAVIFSETSFQYDAQLSKEIAATVSKKRQAMDALMAAGQADGSIRTDISPSQLATIVLGGMRFTVLQWRLSEFKTDLQAEGATLVAAIKMLLRPA